MSTGNLVWNRQQKMYHPTVPTAFWWCGEKGSTNFSGTNSPSGRRTENPYSKTVIAQNDPYIVWRRPNQTNLQYGSFTAVHGSTFFSASATNPWTSNDTIALINKLGEKTNVGEFNPAVFLAQSGETLGMISGTVTSLASAIRKVKKGDMRGAARALSVAPKSKNRGASRSADETSARWLELQYGWLPLLGDLHGAAKALADTVERQQKLTFRVGKTKHYTLEADTTYLKTFYENTYRRQMKVVLSCAPDPLGLTLADPLSIAWEIMPYSFVADWFIPIGDYMNAQRIRRLLSTASVVTSVKFLQNRVVTGYTGYGGNGSAGYRDDGSSQTAYYSKMTFNRTVSSALPDIPLPSVKPLDEVLSWRRAANAISLAYQAFK